MKLPLVNNEDLPSRLRRISPAAVASLFALSMLCAICAFTLVDWNITEPLEPAASTGMTVLEAAGMNSVLAAKAKVDSREKKWLQLKAKVQAAKDQLKAAEQKKVELVNKLDDLDRSVDHKSALISKDAAKAEADSDTAGELILKAREHEHDAKSDHRHSQTALRREKREEKALKEIHKQAAEMSKTASNELKDAMRRQRSAAELRSIARKHLEQASMLKHQIRDVLQSKVTSLSQSIDKSQRAALRATEKAKSVDKQYAKLKAEAQKHENAARLAQSSADHVALAAEKADKAAAELAGQVSADLAAAQNDKHDLAVLLGQAANPQGATTLRTTKPKTLRSSDIALGPTADSSHPSKKEQETIKEMREAAARIKELQKEKRAAEKRAEAEKKAEERLEREMKIRKQKKEKPVAPISRRPASKRYEDNFEASMNYLNNKHLDGATGMDDHGRDAVGRETEGRRAFVGVFGRSPQLDAMASANLHQYEEDETELDRANYQSQPGPTDKNIF